MQVRTYLLLGTVVLCAPLLLVAGTATGCGNEIVVRPNGPPDNTGAGGEYVFLDSGTGGEPVDAGEVKDAFDEYVDPGCPDKPPPEQNFTCDPYAQGNGDCLPGEACYITVEYPMEPCDPEVYGSFCYPAGPGGQGAPCNGTLDCQAGYCCVVTGSGTQCVQLCSLTGDDGCPAGMVCEPIDVVGYGGCL